MGRRLGQATERFTLTRQVSGITPKGFWLGHGAPNWPSDRDVFIARNVILDCDTDLDEVEVGEEITVEIPMWLAVNRGLA